MESISKSGKKFTGKFAETAIKIGLATASEEVIDLKQIKKTRKRKTK
jgi:hypothetical protein